MIDRSERRFLPETLQHRGAESAPRILCVAGFGDDSTMFEPLVGSELAANYELVTFDLPGFGSEPPLLGRFATLSNLGRVVRDVAVAEEASIVLAHSVASIIVSMAARLPGSCIRRIVSLEGNLTADDAYYSGQAIEYEHPDEFHEGFLCLLDDRSGRDPLVARYRSRVARAQPHALWTLGREAVAFSAQVVPGEVLMESAEAHYLYNPANCPESSVAWLRESGMSATELPGTSHWATVDAPALVSRAVLRVLA